MNDQRKEEAGRTAKLVFLVGLCAFETVACRGTDRSKEPIRQMHDLLARGGKP